MATLRSKENVLLAARTTWFRAIITFIFLYLSSAGLILLILWRLPSKDSLQDPEGSIKQDVILKLPTSFSELRAVRHTLGLYQRQAPVHVAILLVATYLFMQVFMVPGCSFMNVLAGSLYGVPIAVPFIALASTLGSSGSFWLSKLLLKDIVVSLFPARIATFSKAVAAQKAQLLPFLIAVRMAPVLPSWFVNLAAPILQIPFRHFVISTAIGLQPTNIVFVQAGASLGSLHSWRDLYGPRSITLLTLCLLAALLPIFVRRHWLKVKPGLLPSRVSSDKEVLQHTEDIKLLVVESPRKVVMVNGGLRLPVSKSLGRQEVFR
ncbi:hypothetical protein CVIRNUC_009185 [Coccomyxa viridis]|uniref:VTT domain-containing protein n=1 Tax=Coccomyxa viridis TaxID=1274662 RepID=A0AAV1IFH2_9CHLO|nr:hypothetical protein CVIRNUC_009185 [Coccomyxa viridis]